MHQSGQELLGFRRFDLGGLEAFVVGNPMEPVQQNRLIDTSQTQQHETLGGGFLSTRSMSMVASSRSPSRPVPEAAGRRQVHRNFGRNPCVDFRKFNNFNKKPINIIKMDNIDHEIGST